MSEIRIIPIAGVPEVRPGDDLAALIVEAVAESQAAGAEPGRTAGADAEPGIVDGDVIVVTQKVVSKAEGRLVAASDRRSAALDESVRVLRRSGEMVISETRHGFVCANAGVDASNVEGDVVALLPLDPDASARRIRARIQHATGREIGIIISDTFGRAWRLGQTDVAIGVAGFDPFTDYRGATDTQGRPLSATRICIADELAGAAEMVMGKSLEICAAIVRGAQIAWARGAAVQIVRPPDEDLFR